MTKKTNLKSKRRGGFYWSPTGDPYLTVTTILKIISKESLMYWFGGEVYDACMIDPTIDKREAFARPYYTNKQAKSRGTAVHDIIEQYKHLHTAIVTDETRPYLEQFVRFMDSHKIEILDQERTIFSDKYRFAGTLDLLVKINGEVAVIDIKTGKDIYQESFIQCSAYAKTIKNYNVTRVGVLLLQVDGYKFETKTNIDFLFSGFLSAKRLYEVMNYDKLVKYGYYNNQIGEQKNETQPKLL